MWDRWQTIIFAERRRGSFCNRAIAVKQSGASSPCYSHRHQLFPHTIFLLWLRRMEGVGSRLGRASSRYGSAPVFSGPVRKWKKQWVSTQPNSLRSAGNTNNVAGPKLMLCRWTPLSSFHSGDSTVADETPKRKFRYAPIVDLEEKKKEAPDNEAKTRKLNHSITSSTPNDNILMKQRFNDIFDEDFEELRTDQSIHTESDLNYDLSLEGCD